MQFHIACFALVVVAAALASTTLSLADASQSRLGDPSSEQPTPPVSSQDEQCAAVCIAQEPTMQINQTIRVFEKSAPPEPFASLNDSIEPFIESFNRASASPRLVALLSATCGPCMAGARAIQAEVLKAHPDADIRVFIVWIPMLANDNADSSAESSSLFANDARVEQFYDGERLLGDQLSRQVLRAGAGPAWDVYFSYGPGAAWTNQAPPTPRHWFHQLSGARRADPALYRTGRALAAELRAMGEDLTKLSERKAKEQTGAATPTVELLWFGSCPLHEAMRESLSRAVEQVGISVQIVEVDLESLTQTDHRRGYGSPTVLVNGKDLFGQPPPKHASLSCRMYAGGVPNAEEVTARLHERLRK